MRRRMCASSACAPQPSQTGIQLLHDENELQRMARASTLCKCDYEMRTGRVGAPIHLCWIKGASTRGSEANIQPAKISNGFLRRGVRSELQGVQRVLPNSARSFPVSS